MYRIRRWILALAIAVPIIAFAASGQAATLKALLVIEDDYQDPGLNSIAASTRMDYGYVAKLLDDLDGKGVLTVEKTLVQGANGTRDNILTLLENMTTGPDDVLFFYFSGHGGMAGGKTFLATADGQPLYREEVEQVVQSKQARLKIVLTDACSSSIDGLGPKSAFLSKDPLDMESAFTEIYKNLFLNHEGLVYITAATEGEYAWGGSSGGAFTRSIVYETLLEDPKLTWDEVFDMGKKRTVEKFNYMVNMGLISPQSLADMKEKGISSQTPKAYSLPSLEGQVDIDEDKVDKIQQPTVPASGDELTIRITNKTGKKVEFHVDGNALDSEVWDWNKVSEHSVGKNKTVTITAPEPVNIFFEDKGENTAFYVLDEGEYAFGLDHAGLLGVYRLNDYDPGKQKKKSPISGSWYWEVWVPEIGDFYITVFTFAPDGSASITDLAGNVLMSGTWKSKVKKHKETIALTLGDGVETLSDTLLPTYYDANTVLLESSSSAGMESEVIMLYRVPDETQAKDYDPGYSYQNAPAFYYE